VVDEDENQRQTAKQIKPEIPSAPLMGIGMRTAIATVIAMCMARNCNAHGRPEASMTLLRITCISSGVI
jgi:hypothetical protein